MKTNIATDESQSDRLLKCGVPAESADMYINNYDELWAVPFKDCARKNEEGFAPAFSLSCLLGLLPKELNDFTFTKWYVPFNEEWEIVDKNTPYAITGEPILQFSDGIWAVDYDWNGFHGRIPQSDNPIEACILAIELLTANGYKLNGIEKGGEYE